MDSEESTAKIACNCNQLDEIIYQPSRFAHRIFVLLVTILNSYIFTRLSLVPIKCNAVQRALLLAQVIPCCSKIVLTISIGQPALAVINHKNLAFVSQTYCMSIELICQRIIRIKKAAGGVRAVIADAEGGVLDQVSLLSVGVHSLKKKC